MKNSIYYFLLIVLIAFSCKDESEIRIPEFKAGPNVRIQIDPNKSVFDFQDKANTYLGYGLYSENKDLEKVEILVTYLPVGGTASAQLVVKTYTQEDINAAGGAIPDERITLASLGVLFGVDIDDFSGGDQFNFNNRTTMADGTIYPSPTVGGNSNVPSDLAASAATTSYTDNFSAVIGCNIAASFTGDYTLEVITSAGNTLTPPAPRYKAGKVTLSAVNPVTRTFTITYFGFDLPFTFVLLCGDVVVNTGSGLACAGVSLAWGTPTPATYNPADDSVIDFVMLDNVNGACGEAGTPYPTVLKLTKL
jgi:hypothetical protein